ncbi:MAG TPA: DUF1573 domain-containing protein [Vicinamibacteria bacterium]
MVLAALEAAPSRAQAAPRLAVEPPGFAFGRVLANRIVHKQFVVRNWGDADLTIEKISTSCGCTAALADAHVIKPGRSTVLRVTVDTRRDLGPVVRSIVLKTNDPAKPLTELKLELTVTGGR